MNVRRHVTTTGCVDLGRMVEGCSHLDLDKMEVGCSHLDLDKMVEDNHLETMFVKSQRKLDHVKSFKFVITLTSTVKVARVSATEGVHQDKETSYIITSSLSRNVRQHV